MDTAELLPRAKSIRLSICEIARRISKDKHTVLRIDLPNRSPLVSTRAAVLRVIEAEELRLRDYLIGLHGLPDLPDDVDTVRVGGVLRRIVKPAMERTS